MNSGAGIHIVQCNISTQDPNQSLEKSLYTEYHAIKGLNNSHKSLRIRNAWLHTYAETMFSNDVFFAE